MGRVREGFDKGFYVALAGPSAGGASVNFPTPEWKRIHGSAPPQGYTWHHKEDGVTMELVRRDVHDKAQSGAAHAGGASIVKSQEF